MSLTTITYMVYIWLVLVLLLAIPVLVLEYKFLQEIREFQKRKKEFYASDTNRNLAKYYNSKIA